MKAEDEQAVGGMLSLSLSFALAILEQAVGVGAIKCSVDGCLLAASIVLVHGSESTSLCVDHVKDVLEEIIHRIDVVNAIVESGGLQA